MESRKYKILLILSKNFLLQVIMKHFFFNFVVKCGWFDKVISKDIQGFRVSNQEQIRSIRRYNEEL